MSLWRTTILFFFFVLTSAAAEEGALDQLRKDVQTAAPATEPSSSPGDKKDADKHDGYHSSDFGSEHHDEDESMGFGALVVGAITSPFWVPHFAIGDNLMVPLSFERFPYDTDSGRMLGGEFLAGEPKTYSWQWRSEYVYQSQHVHRIGGRFLLEGASRVGISTEFGRLSEVRGNGSHDELWLGNCNFLLRFAQSEKMQWRTGIGVNWLADHGAGNAGFNFTYGFDYFPCRPLVASTELDWGQLGHADLFRFRTTGGIVWQHLEAYTGYEYLDIGQTQLNGLIGGFRLWY